MNILQNTASKIVSRIKTFIEEFGRVEILFFFIVMGLIYYTHSVNLFNYPAFMSDEGTYMSQAWAITNLNKLAPYTYWYDHSPLGWMVIAFFSQILGGYNRFGDAISTGRVIMLFMHLVSSTMIILTTKKMTNNIWAGYAAALAFSSLPLMNLFQRRIFLDNILVFFFSFSLYFIADKKINMLKVMLSGLFLGFAILSKESGIFLVPGVFYLVITNLDKKQKVLGAITWLGFFISTTSLYIILAIFKTELVPSSDKVSLIGTLQYMSTRGTGIPFWSYGSDLRLNIEGWKSIDSTSFYFLISVLLIGVIWAMFKLKNKYWVTTLILIFGYLAFLLRGKIVLDFYLIPLGYQISLLFGLIFNETSKITRNLNLKINYKNLINQTLVLILIGSSIFLQFKVNSIAFYIDEEYPSREMVKWIRNNLNRDAKILIDCNMYADFHFPEDKSLIFENADWYWKSNYDREVKDWKYQNNPYNIDYLIGIGNFVESLNNDVLPFSKTAVNSSKLIKRFANSHADSLLFQVVKDKPKVLNNTWEEYKKKYFVNSSIRNNPSYLTSSDQKYGLLQSIINNDRPTFDTIWNFTKNNFQKRNGDKLLASKIQNIDGATSILDSNSSSDAEQDIALSLILANNKWNEKQYLSDAKEIISDLYKLRLTNLNGPKTILQSDSNINKGYDLINMGYLSPAHYRIFNSVNPENNWNQVANDSYIILNDVMKGKTLIPNWVKYNYNSKQYEDATDLRGPTSNLFNAEAAQIYWRLNLDKVITKTQSLRNS